MTIAAFYEQHQIDGRAVIQGHPDQPERWIIRAASIVGEISYWHCQSNDYDIIALDPECEARVLLGFRALGGRPRKPS